MVNTNMIGLAHWFSFPKPHLITGGLSFMRWELAWWSWVKCACSKHLLRFSPSIRTWGSLKISMWSPETSSLEFRQSNSRRLRNSISGKSFYTTVLGSLLANAEAPILFGRTCKSQSHEICKYLSNSCLFKISIFTLLTITINSLKVPYFFDKIIYKEAINIVDKSTIGGDRGIYQ